MVDIPLNDVTDSGVRAESRDNVYDTHNAAESRPICCCGIFRNPCLKHLKWHLFELVFWVVVLAGMTYSIVYSIQHR